MLLDSVGRIEISKAHGGQMGELRGLDYVYLACLFF